MARNTFLLEPFFFTMLTLQCDLHNYCNPCNYARISRAATKSFHVVMRDAWVEQWFSNFFILSPHPLLVDFLKRHASDHNIETFDKLKTFIFIF